MAEARYTTRELSSATWPDFADLFGRGNGWDFCACMFFLQGGHPDAKASREVRKARNHAAHRQLLAEGRAAGVLVYEGARAIGWCQYGRSEHFASGKSLLPPSTADFRITCFVTYTGWRKSGVARSALSAVIEAVARQGGGVVEAYPVATLEPDDPETKAKLDAVRDWNRERGQIIKEGRWEQQARWDAHHAARPAFTVEVAGLGPVRAWDRPDTQLINAGTVRMFEKAGFTPVIAVSGKTDTRVVMQRRVEAA